MSYMMYRETTLGVALKDTLNEFVAENLISKALAAKVLSVFDRNINKALAHKARNKMHFKSDKLVAYRYCDNVWTFIMTDIEIRDIFWPIDQKVAKMKIVACEALDSSPNHHTTAHDYYMD